MELSNVSICIIGLGYVGLPLAIEFAKKFNVIGVDISDKRVASLNQFCDDTKEVSSDELKKTSCKFTTDINDASGCNVYIVGVPTPIDEEFRPDLNPLKQACETVAYAISPGDIVVFESTVYPGTTEEICVPILEQRSGLKLNSDFFVGYSPERINPGDKENTLTTIPKVVSGSTPEVAVFVQELYQSILTAKTHLAPSIKVAEGSKIIENTQRDMNIAIMNEFSRIFSNLNVDLYDVLNAAKTKWNFLPFKPGLVGGHCIGVDPYYLIEKSSNSGYSPDFLVSGRRLNEGMVDFIVDQIVFRANRKSILINGATVLILGYTFKPNCPDIRNTKVEDLRNKLINWGASVTVFDPWVVDTDAKKMDVQVKDPSIESSFDIVISAVNHECFAENKESSIREKYGCRLVFDIQDSIEGAETVYS